MNNEMEIYFSHKTIDCQIPENILNKVKCTFTKFEVETKPCGTLTVSVPAREKELADKLKDDVYKLLSEIKKENSVLAGNLARCYGF